MPLYCISGDISEVIKLDNDEILDRLFSFDWKQIIIFDLNDAKLKFWLNISQIQQIPQWIKTEVDLHLTPNFSYHSWWLDFLNEFAYPLDVHIYKEFWNNSCSCFSG